MSLTLKEAIQSRKLKLIATELEPLARKDRTVKKIVDTLKKGQEPNPEDITSLKGDTQDEVVMAFASVLGPTQTTKFLGEEKKTIKVGEDAVGAEKPHYVIVKDRKVIAKGNKEEMMEKCGEGERVWLSTKDVGDMVEGKEDPDIGDRKGSQPASYHKGLAASTKEKRDAQFRKQSKMSDNDPDAYKPAPGDKEAETKPSKYSSKFKKMFGEDIMAAAKLKVKQEDEKESLKDKHERESEALKDRHEKENERQKMADAAEKEKEALQKQRESQTEETNLIEQNIEKALRNKSEKTGVAYNILKDVYDRGVAAWRTGHRPGTTPSQWGLARVNSFVTGGTTQKTTDADLWKKHTGQKEEFEMSDNKLTEAVRVDDSRYKRSHKKAPRGKGLWGFTTKKMGNPKESETYIPAMAMDYKQAVEMGKKWADRQGSSVVYVLEANQEDMMPASPDEKSMALKQAEFIQYVGREIGEYLVANREFPEWMQNKLSAFHQKAKDVHAVLGMHGGDEMEESVELDESVTAKIYDAAMFLKRVLGFESKYEARLRQKRAGAKKLEKGDIEGFVKDAEPFLNFIKDGKARYYKGLLKKLKMKAQSFNKLEGEDKTFAAMDAVDQMIQISNYISRNKTQLKKQEANMSNYNYRTEGFTPMHVSKAIRVAEKMGGDMTGAVEKIEKIGKGLSDHPKVKAALRMANESFDLTESSATLDKIKQIIDNQQHMKVDGVMVDMFTASAIMKVYNAVNDSNKKRMESLKAPKLADMAMTIMAKRTIKEDTDLTEKAESEAQAIAARIALKHKREGTKPIPGTPSAEMIKMSEKDLEDFTKVKKGAPEKVEEAKMSDAEVLSAAKKLAANGKDEKAKKFGQGLVDFHKENGSFTPDQVAGLQNIMKNASFQMAKEDIELDEGAMDFIHKKLAKMFSGYSLPNHWSLKGRAMARLAKFLRMMPDQKRKQALERGLDAEYLAHLDNLLGPNFWQTKQQDLFGNDQRHYEKYMRAHDRYMRIAKGKKPFAKEELDLMESDFSVGDKVTCIASGMKGEVIKLDEPQTGKYYTVRREDGKVMKYASDELKKVMSEAMDKVDKEALKKKFKDRKDKDIDNDGDVDDSDEYLHNRRKTIAKAIAKEQSEVQLKDKNVDKEPGEIQLKDKDVDGDGDTDEKDKSLEKRKQKSLETE